MSIWHTKQEKPERFRDIICKLLQHKYNGRIVYRNTGDNVDFYLTGVERWAYPEDFEKIESKLDIAVNALLLAYNYAPACIQTKDCPANNGDGYDQGCSRCIYVAAKQALKQIRK